MTTQDRFQGCLLGLACGDAVGTTVEFKGRGTFSPVTDMRGGGPFRLQAGQWTDDTAMALCLAASLTELKRFDLRDQMDRFVRWHQDGYLSCTGTCFDIGTTTSGALERYRSSGDPVSGSTAPLSAGNGSIMRLAPVPMFFFPDHALAIQMAGESSRTTHGAQECVEACQLLAGLLCRALAGGSKEDILVGHGLGGFQASSIQQLADGGYRGKPIEAIRGSGYVVQSLEAALWCFDQTDSYREAVLAAANLGDDADTTAAVVGQLAGAFYGVATIPEHWLRQLAMRREIQDFADQLLRMGREGEQQLA